ncbi:MAG TPA: hypothetical protein PLD59_02120 [Tepidisphaeraceae bacterium]|nr:hypothetical protein [Tepidisphaeraceae bacterium]
MPKRMLTIENLERRLLMAGYEVEGIQSAALSQPQINAYFSRTPNGAPLEDNFGLGIFNLTPFFDTGASGVLLSSFWADLLDVNTSTFAGQDVIFSDIGVGGSEDFFVSESLYLHLGKFHPDAEVNELDVLDEVYTQSFGPLRMQVGPAEPNPNPILEALNVIGMPAMVGKVVVMDPKPVDTFADNMRTYVYNPGTPFNPALADIEPGIPSTNVHVPLTYVNFEAFTTVSPPGAPGPALTYNPFIGRNPFQPGDTRPQPVAGYNNLTSSGDWLFDTGAAASIMSRARAADLGVTYVPGTYGSEDPELQGLAPGTRTFKLTIGGVGGETTLVGFFMDSLTLPTTDGLGLEYIGAPVLIGDITLFDPITSQPYTLDGILGMNYFVASTNVVQLPGDPFPTLEDLTIGAYDWVTFDEPNALLGLQLRDTVPGPTVIATLFEHDVAPNGFYFQFSRNVGASLSLADLVLTNATTGQVIPSSQLVLEFEPALNTATLRFPGAVDLNGILPNGNYQLRVIADGVVDQFGVAMPADQTLPFFSLNADANRDRSVTLNDFTALAANFGLDDRTWAQGDFTLDERVDLNDFTVLAANFGISLPAAAATPRPAVSPAVAQRVSNVFAAGSLIGRLLDEREWLPA